MIVPMAPLKLKIVLIMLILAYLETLAIDLRHLLIKESAHLMALASIQKIGMLLCIILLIRSESIKEIHRDFLSITSR